MLVRVGVRPRPSPSTSLRLSRVVAAAEPQSAASWQLFFAELDKDGSSTIDWNEFRLARQLCWWNAAGGRDMSMPL